MPICDVLTENPDAVFAWVELAEAWTAEGGPCEAVLAGLPRTERSELLGARAATEALARGASGALRARAHFALARLSAAWPCTETDEDGTAMFGTCGSPADAAAQGRLAAAYDLQFEGAIGAWIHDGTQPGGVCTPAAGPKVTLREDVNVCPTLATRAVRVDAGAAVCADGSGCVGLPVEPLPERAGVEGIVSLADGDGEGCVSPLHVELRDETGDGISEVWVLSSSGTCGLAASPGSWRRGSTTLTILDGASGATLLHGEVAVWDRQDAADRSHAVSTILAMRRGGPGDLTLALVEAAGDDAELLAMRRAHPELLAAGRYRMLSGAFRFVE